MNRFRGGSPEAPHGDLGASPSSRRPGIAEPDHYRHECGQILARGCLQWVQI